MSPDVERSRRWQIIGPVARGNISSMRERTQSFFASEIPGTESKPAGLSMTTKVSSSKMIGSGSVGGM